MEDKKNLGAAPASGHVCLPFDVNRSSAVTAEALKSLYQTSERGRQGSFPLGALAHFHSGTDLLVERSRPIRAIAHGEVVAARIGMGPGEHPWGDTGFVLLRHPLADNRSIFSLFVHLQREPLHPDRTNAPWLRRLLLDGAEDRKPKWRVIADAPTWSDQDRGNFSPANMQKGKKLKAGVYEEEDRLGEKSLYVKLQGQWVRAAQDATTKVKEVPPFADFDVDAAARKRAIVAALKNGKVAVLDTDKKDGKRRWTVEAGEPVGVAGSYLGLQVVHWSVFSKDAVFPMGSLPKKEFGTEDQVKLSELDLNEERGDVEHTRKLIEALDPDKKSIGKMPHAIPVPGEVQFFYRTPAECWRSRYLAVKGVTEFALDADKFLEQDRHKSHTDKERQDFKKKVQPFLFWKDLDKADEFPRDGKALFVHPVTAVRLMAARQYLVKVSGWLTPAKDLPGGKDKFPQLPHQSNVSIVLLRVPAATAGSEDTIYKVDLRDGRARVNKLVIGNPKAPSASNMHWSQDSVSDVPVVVGQSYGALWFPQSEKGPLPLEVVRKSLAYDWNIFKPTASDADAGRFIVRRAVRVEIHLNWFDGSPAAGASYALDLGDKRTIQGISDNAGICSALIPVPEGKPVFRLQNVDGDLWTRAFRVVLG
ncbi:MAG TPA: hypothetical protein VEP66_03345 [Myxococcales bacterium]|nr:hypothetical protein [Myxococcales bacterium]